MEKQEELQSSVNFALGYGALGLRVFPLSLEPFMPVRGWPERATTDPSMIDRWWAAKPDSAVAVATGLLSGVFVLDVDQKNGIDGYESLRLLEKANDPLPLTWRSQTPSGGQHIWLQYPRDERVGSRVGVRSGLDVRGQGGFVVAPPSKRESGGYSWLVAPDQCALAPPPAWLLALVGQSSADAVATPATVVVEDAAHLVGYLGKLMDGECADVAAAPPGSRNQRLFRASARIGAFVAAGVIPEGFAKDQLLDAAASCGLPEREALSTINSGFRFGRRLPAKVAYRGR